MYLAHFQLAKQPFGVVPDPDFLYLGSTQARALQALREGVFDRDGCLLLTGDIGTGKTALAKHLARLEGVAAVFITVSGPELNGLDFFRVIAAEFHMNRRFERREAFMADFARMASKRYSAYRKLVVVIDEAQRLTREALKDVIALGGLPFDGNKLLKILLVGQLDWNALAEGAATGGSLPGIAVRCRLDPLTEEDTGNYMAHRLRAAGRKEPLFSAEAVCAIHKLSKGYPRLINIICDHALLYGYSVNRQDIDGRVIAECSRDLSVALDLEDPPEDRSLAAAGGSPAGAASAESDGPLPQRWRSWLFLAVAVLAAAAFFYWITR